MRRCAQLWYDRFLFACSLCLTMLAATCKHLSGSQTIFTQGVIYMPGKPSVPQRPATVVLDAADRERLRRYPRPPQDNGIGLHFHLDLTDQTIAETVEHLKSIGATWTLIYAQDDLQAERAATACFAPASCLWCGLATSSMSSRIQFLMSTRCARRCRPAASPTTRHTAALRTNFQRARGHARVDQRGAA